MKVLFLDIDGPMIPLRAVITPGRAGPERQRFDPFAVGMVLRLLNLAPARLVISSTWQEVGRSGMEGLLLWNGIDPAFLHEEWCTQIHGALESRTEEIQAWLARHPECTAYASLDDDPLDLPGAVTVTFENGMLIEHLKATGALLGIEPARLLHARIKAPMQEVADAAT